MTINPFEPPRATEQPAAALPGGTASEVTEEAIAELVKSVPWARWAGRLALVVAGVSVLEVAARVLRGHAQPNVPLELLALALNVGSSAALWALSRRYARQADRLPAGGEPALSGVVETQQKVFKITGILSLVGLAVSVLSVAAR